MQCADILHVSAISIQQVWFGFCYCDAHTFEQIDNIKICFQKGIMGDFKGGFDMPPPPYSEVGGQVSKFIDFY